MDEEFIRDVFAGEGAVHIRRMFGGYGVYLDGLIVAIVLDGMLMLKGDGETEPLFRAAGCERWVYQRPGGKPVAMPYYSFPTEAYDDTDAMAAWAARARGAAERAARAKPVKRRSRST